MSDWSKATAAVSVALASLGGVWATGNPSCLWALLIVAMIYKAF